MNHKASNVVRNSNFITLYKYVIPSTHFLPYLGTPAIIGNKSVACIAAPGAGAGVRSLFVWNILLNIKILRLGSILTSTVYTDNEVSAIISNHELIFV